MHLDQGNKARSAEHFEYAGHFRDAARLRAELQEWGPAAALYQQAGDFARAGEMYHRAGDLVRAGRAYESASDLDRALGCYREARDTERVLGVLERRGEAFEAAQLARDSDDRSRAIKLLQQVLPDDPNYTEACLMRGRARDRGADLAARRTSGSRRRRARQRSCALGCRSSGSAAAIWRARSKPGRSCAWRSRPGRSSRRASIRCASASARNVPRAAAGQ
jgi:tetratricopeptide (TPR) repeat protein